MNSSDTNIQYSLLIDETANTVSFWQKATTWLKKHNKKLFIISTIAFSAIFCTVAIFRYQSGVQLYNANSLDSNTIFDSRFCENLDSCVGEGNLFSEACEICYDYDANFPFGDNNNASFVEIYDMYENSNILSTIKQEYEFLYRVCANEKYIPRYNYKDGDYDMFGMHLKTNNAIIQSINEEIALEIQNQEKKNTCISSNNFFSNKKEQPAADMNLLESLMFSMQNIKNKYIEMLFGFADPKCIEPLLKHAKFETQHISSIIEYRLNSLYNIFLRLYIMEQTKNSKENGKKNINGEEMQHSIDVSHLSSEILDVANSLSTYTYLNTYNLNEYANIESEICNATDQIYQEKMAIEKCQDQSTHNSIGINMLDFVRNFFLSALKRILTTLENLDRLTFIDVNDLENTEFKLEYFLQVFLKSCYIVEITRIRFIILQLLPCDLLPYIDIYK
ncbi:hypothetical protein EDEG_03551 [Edhazardia aedis USNM 41457]|uniref:Uncharacterized protein n=1 Tax=Edhazardia aedis (strain USNM 41457) TaxID=1003232 RepID=J9D2D2_EDHAE|nr:hypothetical protein EDEG_03551 [Edhazardia aedis USNM 41457]|eukprot:EJW01996.1 hypothetical protein EDEG_03551 [Edhazardia aedis USNM 41457]